jgi:hypothetical protein
MSHFAYVPLIVNGKGNVENVIKITQEELDLGLWGDPTNWVQTSYSTYGGIHYGFDGKPDGGIALRANYAGINGTYDSVNNVFYAPQPYPSWVLNAQTYLWEAPVPCPADGQLYTWGESTQSWALAP